MPRMLSVGPASRALLIGENIRLNFLAIVVGSGSGLIGVGFTYLITLVKNLFFYQRLDLADVTPLNHSLGGYVVFVPMVGGFFVGLLVMLAKEAKGHGVPEVMEAMALRGGKIRPRVTLVKSVASAICIGSGGSVGREGPIIQVGSAAGSTIAQYLRLPADTRRILVACGAAAGISSVFNTPVAGVLFALEIILLEFKTRSFVPLVVSSVFGGLMARIFFGSRPAFEVPAYTLASPYELVFYLLLGLLAGILAVICITTLYTFENFFDQLPAPQYLVTALGGLLLGGVGYFFPQVFGSGYEVISMALNEEMGLYLLLALVVTKLVAMCLTLGSGGSGGVFSPSLFVGAMFGGVFGWVVHGFFPEATASHGAYALVGMAAVFAGATRATLTAIIMVFEMTLDYNIILPLMFACVISDITSKTLYEETIYTKKLVRRGVLISHDMEVNPFDLIPVRDVMIRDVDTVNVSTPLYDVWEKLISTGHQGFPVLDNQKNLVGIITSLDLRKALRQGKIDGVAGDVATRKLVVTYPQETLSQALRKMVTHGVGHLPVVNRDNPKELVGFLTHSRIIDVTKKRLE